MKASDLFLKCLENEGVDTIYGVPGEENADLMNSLLDSPIEFITCRHEQGAAFMADIHGRITGRPGVCLATLGPGATNLVTGVANANMDRSPVVAIAGQAETTRLHKESHQNMDIVSLFSPITKWSSAIYHSENIPEVVRKAFKLAAAEKPGACLVELPEDVAGEEVGTDPFRGSLRFRRPGPDGKAIAAACSLLRKAAKPIILAGAGTVRTRASKHLRGFIEQTGIFGATTFMGKGSISARDPHSLFTGGLQSRDHVTEAFREADLVVCIGYDMVEWHPSIWNQGKDKIIIHIDFDPAEVDEHYRTNIEVIGDVAGSLKALRSELGDLHFDPIEEFAEERRHIIEDMKIEASSDSFPMKPQRILRDLREVMGDDDILISDVGAHKMWIARHYPTYTPGSCIISNGFCSMGIAVPGAIAAKKLRPEKNVVGLCGDGGFLMNVQELATAVQYRIPATFMIWQDDGYGLIEWKQETRFGRASNTTIENPSFLALAESFGCNAVDVKEANELTPSLQNAFSEKTRPTVINVRVDYSENMRLTERLGRVIGRS